jgi:very-short-patch-repair endonuclease
VLPEGSSDIEAAEPPLPAPRASFYPGTGPHPMAETSLFSGMAHALRQLQLHLPTMINLYVLVVEVRPYIDHAGEHGRVLLVEDGAIRQEIFIPSNELHELHDPDADWKSVVPHRLLAIRCKVRSGRDGLVLYANNRMPLGKMISAVERDAIHDRAAAAAVMPGSGLVDTPEEQAVLDEIASRVTEGACDADALTGVTTQVSVLDGRFRVDFLHPATGVVLEIDGPEHYTVQGRLETARRDEALWAAGHTEVLHRANESVRADVGAVVDAFATRIEAVSQAAEIRHRHAAQIADRDEAFAELTSQLLAVEQLAAARAAENRLLVARNAVEVASLRAEIADRSESGFAEPAELAADSLADFDGALIEAVGRSRRQEPSRVSERGFRIVTLADLREICADGRIGRRALGLEMSGPGGAALTFARVNQGVPILRRLIYHGPGVWYLARPSAAQIQMASAATGHKYGPALTVLTGGGRPSGSAGRAKTSGLAAGGAAAG